MFKQYHHVQGWLVRENSQLIPSNTWPGLYKLTKMELISDDLSQI